MKPGGPGLSEGLEMKVLQSISDDLLGGGTSEQEVNMGGGSFSPGSECYHPNSTVLYISDLS